jgi:hypothetical protein
MNNQMLSVPFDSEYIPLLMRKKNGLIIVKNVRYWFKDDLYHRINGPAIEYMDLDLLDPNRIIKQWYFEGLLHRENGPASECADGNTYWYHGENIDCETTEEFLKIIKLKAFW